VAASSSSSSGFITTSAGQVYTIVEGMLHLPRIGVWHADVTLDAPGSSSAATMLSGKATVSWGGTPYSGTFALNGPTQRDTIRARINGGGSGFGKIFQPKGYRATTIKQVVGDILNTAGESLSPTADPNVLAYQLPYWTAMQQGCGIALQSVLQVTGSAWRLLPDGSLWFGTETYPASQQTDFVQIRNEPELARYEFSSYSPTILPGTAFKNQRVSAVIHYINPGAMRSQLLYE
jgi:hypothetical protein